MLSKKYPNRVRSGGIFAFYDIILVKISDKLIYGLLRLREYLDDILSGLKTYDDRYYDTKNVEP